MSRLIFCTTTAFVFIAQGILALGESNNIINDPHETSPFCRTNSYFEFIPVHKAQIPVGQNRTWTSPCFKSSFAQVTLDQTKMIVKVNFDISGSKSWNCFDDYIIASREHSSLKMQRPFIGRRMQSSLTLKLKTQRDLNYVLQQGISVLYLPCGLVGTAKSVKKTSLLFTEKNYEKRRQLTKDFFREKMAWDPEDIDPASLQPLDPKYIKSGDVLQILMINGLDPMIAYGIGGHTGHTAIFLRDPAGELFVCESTDANPFAPDDWPPPYGVIKTPYEQWIKQAEQVKYSVVVTPMSEEIARKFDAAAAWEFFETVEEFKDVYPVCHTDIQTSFSLSWTLPCHSRIYHFQLMTTFGKLF
eukprot:759716_1